MTKQQIIDAARDPRKTNIGNVGAALVAAARKGGAEVTFPGEQPEHIDGQLDLDEVGAGDPIARAADYPEWVENPGDTLGPCGCVDYHMADCPLVTGRDDTGMTKDDYLDLYAGSYPDDWPDYDE